MDNFKVIYRILRYLEKATDYDELDMDRISATTLGLTEKRWVSLMEMLASKGYVNGVSVKYSLDGNIEVSMPNPRITLEGLEYLQENRLIGRKCGRQTACKASRGKGLSKYSYCAKQWHM